MLNKRMEISRNIYNACLGQLKKRLNLLKQSKEYRRVLKMEKSAERNKLFGELNKIYGLTENSLHTYVKPMQQHFKENIDSNTSQKIATRCFNAFKNVIYYKSKNVPYKRFGELNSVEGKKSTVGIRFKENKLFWNRLVIPVILHKNDDYANISLTKHIKYCRITRSLIRGNYKYYLQLIIEGVPPVKINKETGEVKNSIGIGRVGIDIGTQTIAISSKFDVKLLELAPEINNIEYLKSVLYRKLERQRRLNNPHKFNKDGTYKKGNKDKWVFSNRYIRTRNQLKEIQRKNASIRKQSHNKLANWIVMNGNKVFVETMDYKKLQMRIQDATTNKKRKRFGKSLANKSPSMLLSILDNKLKWHNEKLIKIDTYSIKASQYNHITNECIKKPLNQRWNNFGEFKIQRDLYSAFLIMCVKDNLKEINRDLCFKEFGNFKQLHDQEINRIKNSNNKLISSMGF